MPARKRKAPAKADSATNKKVRIDDSPNVSAEPMGALSSRPKRKSVGMPEYNLTRLSRSIKKQADNGVKADDDAVVPAPEPRKRGRPAKSTVGSAPASVSASKSRTTTKATPKSAKKVEDAAAPRKRGRPPKSDAPTTTKTGQVKKTSSAAKASKGTVKPAKPATKGTDTPRKRGRPPKSQAAQTASTLLETDTDTLSGADEMDDGVDDEANDRQYWLMKAEPNDRYENGVNVKFGIDDLSAATAPEPWDGVRNYSARNNMRAMRKGDLAFFYHSNCPVPGVVGIMRIVQEHVPDLSAFDPAHPYFDPKSSPDAPKWDCVHVEFVKKFETQITLKMLQENKNTGGQLERMQLLRLGRLSVSKVEPAEWKCILEMANEDEHVGEVPDGETKAGGVVDGYESDTDGEVEDGPKEELNGDVAAQMEAEKAVAGDEVVDSEMTNGV